MKLGQVKVVIDWTALDELMRKLDLAAIAADAFGKRWDEQRRILTHDRNIDPEGKDNDV